ncbi:uncharacterized protein LOC128730814 [Anopheles nili]|uniref:uncharacterized protein LOC128730814 n=1 Tax=Anopheles nili TaxID=185578 RepID=UPI00237B8D3C|nr:uncharacterized protein LOC128730814 [Anopheles nili]
MNTNGLLFSKNFAGNRTTSYTYRVVKVQCIGAPYKHTRLNHCKLEIFPNATTGVNISITVPMILNYVEISVQLFYKYNSYRPFMIDWSIEYCQAFRSERNIPSTALLLKVIAVTLSDFYYQCPHGNRTYYDVWMLDTKLIPPTIPSGDYRLDISLKDSSNIPLIRAQIFGAVRKHGIFG